MKFVRKSDLLFGLVCLFFLIQQSPAQAQTHTAKLIPINANCNGYYEYLPQNYSTSGAKYPLIIYCSGAGALGTGSSVDLQKLLTEGVPYYINNNTFPKTFTVNGTTSSFVVISPQFINWPSPDDITQVINFIVARNYQIDQSRIYLTGFSAGGNVAWKYPNSGLAPAGRIAADVPVAGYNYPYVDSGAKYIAAANLPVWALHSDDDQTAPSTWSQNFVNKINSFSPKTPAIITRFTGATHDGTKLVVYNPTYKPIGKNIYEWMLQYARNFPPVANAGPDRSVTLPTDSTVLDGSLSSDPEGDRIIYQWTKIKGPSKYVLADSTKSVARVSSLVAGKYDFLLKAADTTGRFSYDTMSVTVINPGANSLPLANAGKDTTINFPVASFTVDGSASSDPGGVVESYAWRQVSGPVTLTLGTPAKPSTTVAGFKPGLYSLELAVTDNESGIGRDTINIQVFNPNPNLPAVALAGADVSTTVATDSVVLDGTASYDTDGLITAYNWRIVSGSGPIINNAASAKTSIRNLSTGIYLIELAVTDNSNAISRDTLQLIVTAPPIQIRKYMRVNLYGGVNPYNNTAWNNWNVAGADALNLSSAAFNYDDATVSTVNAVLSSTQNISDNGATYGGTMCPPEVLRYASYSSATSRTLSFKGLNDSLSYDFEFYASRGNTGNTSTFTANGQTASVVTDNNKATKALLTGLKSAKGLLTVTITKTGSFNYLNGFTVAEVRTTAAVAPIAKAGPDVTLYLPQDSTLLDASASFDPDGTISSYTWLKLSGPASITIVSPSAKTTMLRGLTAGIYALELTVRDNQGNIGKDTLNVTVNAPSIIAPFARAGKDTTIQLPADSAFLNGNASYDPDGSIVSYTWAKVSGPTTFKIDSSTAKATTVRNLVAGTYSFELTVVDNQGNVGKDTMNVTAKAPVLFAPVAKAGNDTTIILPSAGVPLNGSGSFDPDGTILQYRWKETSGPAGATILDSTAQITSVSGLAGGIHSFVLSVQDNSGLSSTDTVVVTVRDPALNTPPVAVAGIDQALTLPTNTTTLNGTASNDPDGRIVTVAWTQLAPGAAATIATPTQLQTSVSFTTAGTYSFELLVTDDLGAIGRDTVNVVMNPKPNQSPFASAGPDQSITLPKDSTLLDGSLSNDPDGSIASYSWRALTAGSPSPASPGAAQSMVRTFLAGVYLFELTVVDNQGASSKDTVQVTVNSIPTTVTRNVRVNLYGGVNPYTGAGWNNWNVSGADAINLNSGALTYDDNTASPITAQLSYSQNVSDNGATYGGTMCPPAVLRYTSYASATSRTLTLSGLNNAAKYDIELYGSRANTGNSTRFDIGATSKTIVTDNNKSSAALFTDVVPTAGKIVVTVTKLNSFSYLNGFVVTEKAPTGAAIRSQANPVDGTTIATTTGDMALFPNPARDVIHLKMPAGFNGHTTGLIFDQFGRLIRKVELTRSTVQDIDVHALPEGLYFLQVADRNNRKVVRFLKHD